MATTGSSTKMRAFVAKISDGSVPADNINALSRKQTKALERHVAREALLHSAVFGRNVALDVALGILAARILPVRATPRLRDEQAILLGLVEVPFHFVLL